MWSAQWPCVARSPCAWWPWRYWWWWGLLDVNWYNEDDDEKKEEGDDSDGDDDDVLLLVMMNCDMCSDLSVATSPLCAMTVVGLQSYCRVWSIIILLRRFILWSRCGVVGNLVIRQEAIRSYTTTYKKAPVGVIFILNTVGNDVRKRWQGIYLIIPKSHVVTFPSPRKSQPWKWR